MTRRYVHADVTKLDGSSSERKRSQVTRYWLSLWVFEVLEVFQAGSDLYDSSRHGAVAKTTAETTCHDVASTFQAASAEATTP
jgi:hypothetical protein